MSWFQELFGMEMAYPDPMNEHMGVDVRASMGTGGLDKLIMDLPHIVMTCER
jgi:hypothetical protein